MKEAGSVDPLAGRCGAKLRNGRFCAAYPLKGRPHCKRHNGGRPNGAADQRNVVFGWSSQAFVRASAKGRGDLGALLADPELLDAKRPVAVLTAELLGMPVGIDEDRLIELTQAIAEAAGTRIEGELHVVITPETIAKALDIINGATVRTAAAQSKAIATAKRVERANELVLLRATPILSVLGESIATTARAFVPPERLPEFLEIVRNRFFVTIGQLTDLATAEAKG